MMVRLRSKTTQITATISPFRADPGGTQIPIVILSTRIQIFLHFGSINGLSLSVYLRTNLAGTLVWTPAQTLAHRPRVYTFQSSPVFGAAWPVYSAGRTGG